MDKVVHIEVPADDIKRAKAFYSEIFGWQMQDIPEMNYTILQTVNVDEQQMPIEPGAINGGLFQRQADMPHPQFFINVANIESSLAKIKDGGGEIIREKTPVGNMGFVANFKDSEGNVVGLWEDNK
jgi:predicted enzyme related to lactoylglutathione lyase